MHVSQIHNTMYTESISIKKANKITIDVKQCNIFWYVDDLKISNVSPSVVDRVTAAIEEKFGKMSMT